MSTIPFKPSISMPALFLILFVIVTCIVLAILSSRQSASKPLTDVMPSTVTTQSR